MALAKSFIPHKPIADQDGPELVSSVRDCLEHLRNISVSGLAPFWNFLNVGDAYGGSYEQPSHLVWQNWITKEWIFCEIEWDTNAQPVTISWFHRTNSASSWRRIGDESLTWSVNGNLTSSSWSGSVTYPKPFDKTKPDTSQYALTAIDSIRENLMALYDDSAVKLGDHWDYSISTGTGTESQPEFITLTKGTDYLRGAITWLSSGSPSAIMWQFDSGSGYKLIGTQTITYEDGWSSSYSWSVGDEDYKRFTNASPTGTEANGNDTLNKIREQLVAINHASAIGVLPGWSYFWSADPEYPESSNAEMPEAMVYFNAPYAVIVVNTYGSAGIVENCITKQDVWYSDNSGTTYDKTFSVVYTYSDEGIVKQAVWDGTTIFTVEEAELSTEEILTWDDSETWDDDDYWTE